jgi:hypothetical protein
MSGPSQPDPIERALEVFVYAPLGIGLWLRDLTPSLLDTVVARGKAEIDRRQEQAQQRITTARSMGQVAIAFGVPELRKRADAQLAKAEQQLGAVREQAEQFVEQLTGSRPGSNGHATREPAAERGPSKATTSATPPKPTARAAAAPSAPAEPAPTVGATDSATARSTSSAHLPIPGYDALSASQVVERLAGLGPDELAAVRDYETEHRNRRTILGKITQLTS